METTPKKPRVQLDRQSWITAAIEVMAETGQPEHIDALRETRRRFADDPFIGFAADVAIERIRAA